MNANRENSIIMELITFTNPAEWNQRLLALVPEPSFLQSAEWGAILTAEGKPVERLVVREGAEVLAQAQVVYQELPLGWRYALCPKGPVIKVPSTKYQVQSIYELIKNYLAQKNCVFFRIEPLSATSYPLDKLPRQSSGQVRAGKLQAKTVDLNPRATVRLDLAKTPEALLTGMHKKTRYCLRRAKAAELVIREEKNAPVFLKLLAATARRDRFRGHPDSHYQAILGSPLSYQLTAYQGEIPVASAIFVAFAKTLTYLFAASDYRWHELCAPYQILWEGIRLGGRLGCERLDLFGLAPPPPLSPPKAGPPREDNRVEREERPTCPPKLERGGGAPEYAFDPKHPYAKFTTFKLRWGGTVVDSPGTSDLIISPGKYKVYQWLKKLRRIF